MCYLREFGFAENVRHLGSRMRRIGLGPAEKKVGSGSSTRPNILFDLVRKSAHGILESLQHLYIIIIF